MNIISLLNCFYREDVITDLLSHLINSEEKFAKWFIKTICNISNIEGTFKSHTRVGLGKGIGTPDLIIEKKNDSITNMIIVIENKLGALEGAEQSNRYASSDGREKLYSQLKVEKNVPIHFLFLTLDPYTKAENSSFDNKDYRHFVNVEWKGLLQDTTAAKVMSDFSSLLKGFYDPILSAKLSDDISQTTKSLDPLQKKLIWINMLQLAQDRWSNKLKMTFGEAGGSGRNSAVFIFSKTEWKQNYYDGIKLSANSINIHFELSINLLNFSHVSDFALHYEPNPYKPKREYSNAKGYKDYEVLREKRRAKFHESIKDLGQKEIFTPRMGSNSILRIRIKENKRFEDVVDELINSMDRLTPLIDDIVNIF